MTCRSSLGQAFGSGQRRDCRLKGDLCVAEGNALGTHSIRFQSPKGVFNRDSVIWFEVPRQGTWICGSTSGGAAPSYEDSGLQPACTSKFFSYRTDPFLIGSTPFLPFFGSGQRRDCRLKCDLCVAECNALGTHSIKFPAPKGCSTVIQSSGLKCRYRAHEFAGQLPGALPPATKIQAYSLPSRADSGASPESFSPASSNHALGGAPKSAREARALPIGAWPSHGWG